MKYNTRLFQSMLWSTAAAAVFFTWSGCSKTETTDPVINAVQDVGAPKLQSDPFIKIIGGPPVNFHLCDTYTPLTTSAPGPAVPYICQQAVCPAAMVTVKNGVAPNIVCFNTGPGTSYRIKADTGPANRMTLKFTYPAGYNECVLNPATCFNYNSTTGIWSVTTPLYGITWYQLLTTCP
ncbi:MAG: hypothetical protein KA230_13685 [Flavobacteriales bacterium]|nr:hypothetical protein [Flavobacteriales bacterium]MBK9196371.1 hypothetical protein [Flavobacteriales bacterium]MBP6575498.1 hypothetical protein [Flavobacteriales bacterium]